MYHMLTAIKNALNSIGFDSNQYMGKVGIRMNIMQNRSFSKGLNGVVFCSLASHIVILGWH